MKGRRFVILFRLLVILTFFAGMVYLISFVSLAGSSVKITPEEFLSACRRWTIIFFIYLLMCVGSTVLSVMETRTSDRKHLAILRTAVLGFAGIADILAVRYIAAFRGYEDAVEAAKAVDGLIETGTVFIIMSFVGAMLLFFLMISSVYYIVRIKKADEFDEVVEPNKPQEKKGQ